MLAFDLEADGLLDTLTTIHCLHITDRATGRAMRFSSGVYADGTLGYRDGSVEEGVRLLQEADEIAGQNIIKYDIPAIRKLFPWFSPKGRIHDSLVYSRLIWTDLKTRDSENMKRRRLPAGFTGGMVGSHSLEAWGFRMGIFKGDYAQEREAAAKAAGITDAAEIVRYVWGSFNQAMDDYCAQDVVATIALLERIEAKAYADEALQLEMDVAKIIALQEDYGFLFNKAEAERLEAQLMVRRAQLEDQLRAVFKPWYEPVRYKGAHKVVCPKTGNRAHGYVADCPLTKVQLVVFNPASRDHIANRLTKLYGWTPVEFTDSGKPKVDESTLDGIFAPEAKVLVEYLTVDKRIGQLATGKQAWLLQVQADGRIHGSVNTNGAVTGRMTHSGPNMAQVPSVRLDDNDHPLLGYAGGWGYECRSLFVVPPGKRLVGCDAEGLELRMLAHYMARFDGGAYIDTVINGKKADGTDVHSVNTRAAGLRLRANGKTFIYAYLYGAGNWKLGLTVVEDMTEEKRAAFFVRYPAGQTRDDAIARLGGQARRRIEEGLPALGKLQEDVKATAKRGYLRSLDGRLLTVRAQHSALNTLLQGGGAVVMKRALVLCDSAYDQLGWTHGSEYAFVANVHDEFQMEVQEEHADTAGQTAAWAIAEAGRSFNLRCPLAGAYQIGLTWADSH